MILGGALEYLLMSSLASNQRTKTHSRSTPASLSKCLPEIYCNGSPNMVINYLPHQKTYQVKLCDGSVVYIMDGWIRWLCFERTNNVQRIFWWSVRSKA